MLLGNSAKANLSIALLKIEFADHVLISLSDEGKFGEMTLSLKYAPLVMNTSPVYNSLDTRTILGSDKVNSHLLTRRIEKELNTSKIIIVSTKLKRDVSSSDAHFICQALLDM
ncbi:unnamed protein product [Calicophoron daubneyi]|uniref:Proteasome assembly chaperone 3 n=1 Tax=Calicophoron daubneyi TaxID=300641 RepID=A0AAV2TG28_CALDB